MSFFEYLSKEKYSLVTNLLVSSAGFLTALIIDKAQDRRRERIEFKSLLSCVATEAISNGDILRESFLKFLDGGMVTRPLSTICVESTISSPLFARYGSKADYELITRYLRQLLLLNGNRQMHYDLSINGDERNWMPGLVLLLRERISEAEKIIQEVAARAQ